MIDYRPKTENNTFEKYLKTEFLVISYFDTEARA